jgi:hypothetical protein
MMAVNFVPGTSHYIQCADAADFDGADGGGDKAKSFSFWMAPDVVNINQHLFSKWATTNEYRCYIRNDAYMDFLMKDTGSGQFLYIYVGAGTITASKYHVAITYDGSVTAAGVKLYLNGSSTGTAVKDGGYSGMQANGTGAFHIGSQAGTSNYFDGLIEDFRMWSQVLTPEQVAMLNAGYRGPIGGEKCWLDLQLARGAYTGNLTQGTHVFNDLSGTGNDGDPYNTPTLVPSEFLRMGVAV